MRNATVVFLLKRSKGKVSEVCLAMKKRGFGVNRWNGAGGKVDDKIGETIEAAAVREAHEEIGVKVKDLAKVAELTFIFPHNSEWSQLVHVYFAENWEGVPLESEEMRPQWFEVDKIPYDSMWPDDEFWLPLVLDGKHVLGKFVFGEGDTIQEKDMKVVTTFQKSRVV